MYPLEGLWWEARREVHGWWCAHRFVLQFVAAAFIARPCAQGGVGWQLLGQGSDLDHLWLSRESAGQCRLAAGPQEQVLGRVTLCARVCLRSLTTALCCVGGPGAVVCTGACQHLCDCLGWISTSMVSAAAWWHHVMSFKQRSGDDCWSGTLLFLHACTKRPLSCDDAIWWLACWAT
jgi:hypothetical protein